MRDGLLIHVTTSFSLTFSLSPSCPGDPTEETYYDSTPPLANAALNFVGAVTYHHSVELGFRLFGVDLSVYKERIQDKVVMQDFRIACLFDSASPRWKNYRLPLQNRYVHVSGKTLGFFDLDGCRSLCVLISDLSYLPASSTLPSTPSTVQTAPSPAPRHGPRTWGDVLPPPTPLKRRHQSPSPAGADRHSPSAQLLPEVSTKATPDSDGVTGEIPSEACMTTRFMKSRRK